MGRLFAFLAFLFAGAASSSASAEPKPEPEPEPVPNPKPGSGDPGWLHELQSELEAAGVENFSAKEITWLPKAKPPRVDEPPREYWPNLIRAAQIAQRLRDAWGHPLRVSSGWRPPWYNKAVGGAQPTKTSTGSKHTYGGGALDVNLVSPNRTAADEAAFFELAREMWEADPEWRGLGLYHFGRVHLDSIGGKRSWGAADEYE